MDSPNSTKDVVPCSLCQTHEASMYCEVCHKHLCKACKGEHLFDSSKEHRVVPVKQSRTTLNYSMCSKHPILWCRYHCEQCDIAMCRKCFRNHPAHKIVKILQNSEGKEVLQTELQESEKSIHPKYEEIASNISMQITDLIYSAQDVVSCSLCHTLKASKKCEVCHVYLCKTCEWEHLCDSSKNRCMVQVKQCRTTLNYSMCSKHPILKCRHHCEQCDIAICRKCFRNHPAHKIVEILQNSEDREVLQTELQESEKSIHPKYEEIASNISVQIAGLIKNSRMLVTAIKKQGKIWQTEIGNIITNLETDPEEKESKHPVILKKQEDEIIRTISEITQIITDLMKLLDLKDDSKSKNVELKKLPPEPKLSLSNLRSQEIHTDQLIDQSGSQSEQDNNDPTNGAECFPPDRSLLDVPRVVTSIDTGYEYQYGVACLNDTDIMTHGNNNIIKLYNLHGELVRSIQTESRNHPSDIAVTRNGDIVYTDYKNGTVNIVKDTRIETVIRLERWKPLNVCSTYSGDLLVVINNDDDKQTKVVRYSGSTEKQTMQYDRRKSRPLYSSGGLFSTKYICENRNLDICVSDRGANAVVVVNQAGKLRFTYTGPPSTPKESFSPLGITTDSQSRILMVDWDNDCIHIMDQDGQFIRYIDNCHVLGPSGLCVDSRDNLFVADDASKVKKIQYYM